MDDFRKRLEEFKASMEPPRPDAVTRAKPDTERQKSFDEYRMAQQEARERLLSELPGRSVSGAIPGAVGALAGYGAQIPGGFGDLASLYQSFKPESFGDLPAGVQSLPTTDDIQDLLREYINDSPEFSAGMTGGNAVALGQGAAALPALVKGAAKGAPKLLGNLIDEILAPRSGPRGQRGAAGYRDPSATKIADWKWRDIEDVKKDVPLTEVPDYIQGGYGQFLKDQAQKASNKELTERDLLKAYLITQSSIGRGGLPYSTATKTGLKLPNASEIRPEGAFATWLGSPQGQRYLAAAERGEIDPKALEDIRQKFAPFGKQNQLVNQMADAVKSVQAMTPRLNEAITGSADDYRDFAEQLRGIAAAKSGFVGSLLGRGDLPTFDARQIGLHTKDMPMPTASVGSMLSRGKGLGGREAVDRLTARQEELGLKIDPALAPHYQHLTHHAVWDALGGEKTTHKDLIEAMKNYANGGPVSQDAMNMAVMNQKVQKRGGGGVMKGVKALMNTAEEVMRLKDAAKANKLAGTGMIGKAQDIKYTAADRAEAGRKAAKLIASQKPVKASEALGQLMEKGFKKTTTTQSDRTRVGGGNIGGGAFSAIGEADPGYADKAWGVMDTGTASRLINLNTPETAWIPMLGSATQLKTNPIVFDKLARQFQSGIKKGLLSPELEAKINQNLEVTFGQGASIRDPNIWKLAGESFDNRAALADLMMGQGIAPSKGGIALGGEKSGKGVIFKPTETLIRETEPSLLHAEHGGDVPTFATGPRLFSLSGESSYRPDLHPGFPTLLHGEDQGFNVIPTPNEVYLPNWYKEFREKKPERFQGPWAEDIIDRRKSKSYQMKGAEGPGYYDVALGLKGEGLPSQELNDEYIRHLIREGFKKGGVVQKKADGGLTSDDLVLEERML